MESKPLNTKNALFATQNTSKRTENIKASNNTNAKAATNTSMASNGSIHKHSGKPIP